ncbi:nonsense-mediated mRNA decay protein 3 [Galdieria sulphuraria]|uniref:60S ribosomal export protein NMD3 n=1 Tax=Galdieria sulphuraria TaxID=130081 RepID=M2XV22_GALSU|nr:nonsense-mediated mRNA decay protein 3 [Galdieria sulphuraria]EME27493.1 nonsense-mediated mRNA decay protein 3 [Galdieria sulphuraria]|eukprot:XP_005704013.1 nonsense-mediated mRNA decay protein 3 [Galdieria sulphuraria]
MEQMDTDQSNNLEPVVVTHTLPTILCCTCGVPISPNPSNMCVNCIRSRVDITETIPKQITLYFCKFCSKYHVPPSNWVYCEPESKELLALCVARIRGLNKLHLVDANFIWTEPHSRRIKVKLTVQKEVFNHTILQQSFIVEYCVDYQQCYECRAKSAKMDPWEAVVQVRQRADHKKTFYFLEQLILKHNAHGNTLSLKTLRDGLDFYFPNKSAALKFVDFLHHVVPVRMKNSDHLVSHDPHNTTYKYKYSFSAELPPVCRDDLVCLPKKVSTSLGGLGPLVLVSKVSQNLCFIDPLTLQTGELSGYQYWKYPFLSLLTSRRLVEFTVLDCELTGESQKKYCMGDVTVSRSSDLGITDRQFYIRSHVAKFLKAGDLVLGYDLESANYNDSVLDEYRSLQLPDVILVRKTYPTKNQAKRRRFKLKRLAKKASQNSAMQMDSEHNDYDNPEEFEEFLQDLEQDIELRSNIQPLKMIMTIHKLVSKSF